MATKILFNGNRIIIDGHADTPEECRAITAMCDSMANNENFKTIVYEEGHAVFEQVSGGESELFAMKDYVLTSRYNDETGYSAAELAAKGTIKWRLDDLEYFQEELENNYIPRLEAQIAALAALIGTLPEGANTVIGYVDKKTYAPKRQFSITASELAQKLGVTLVPEPESGLYDASGVQLASWDKLVNYYDMEIEGTAYNTTPAHILSNNAELSAGVKLIIPKDVTKIRGGAFSDCTGLTSLIVDAANPKYHSAGNCIIETASKTLVSGCKTSVILTDGNVTSIGSYAFYNCTGLTSIVIPDSVTSIGDDAFKGCTGLTSATLGNGVTSIGDRAFYKCTGLTSVTLGNGVTSIGSGAFHDCTGLTSVTIGSGVTSIGSYDFDGCTSLTSVTIGSGVTSIGSYAFHDCAGLTSIAVDPNNTTYHSDGNCIIETASKTLIRGCKNSMIPADGSVTSIGDRAFYKCTSLTSIVIPDSVTSVGSSAFNDCTGLTSVTLGNGVTRISGYTFDGCTGLTSIVIPDSVTSISGYAFNDCTGLTSVTIGSGVTSIDENAFDDCTSLTSIVIPDSVTSISGYAFNDCTGLTSVTLGNGVTRISGYTFDGCTGLTSIVIPDSVTSISGYAFKGCTGLTSVTIGSGVTSIGSYAFDGCTNITTINVPWAEGTVAYAPWGASNATINYNYTGE